MNPNPTSTARAVAPASPAAFPIGPLVMAALDELDYGMVLTDTDATVLHLNHRATRLLGSGETLVLSGGRLHARESEDQAQLVRSLRDATERGLRRLITLGDGDTRRSVAVVPVQTGVAALMIGRSSLCEDLSLQCFARAHALSGAEARVLAALGRGDAPMDIARAHGVALSTVRTQIGAIRDKTGTGSIRELLRTVAALPPIVGALRH